MMRQNRLVMGYSGQSGRSSTGNVPRCYSSAWMDRRNHVLDGSPEVLRDVALTTNSGTKIALNWLSVNDSD